MMTRLFTILIAASGIGAIGQSEYCLEGTVWDDELQGCIVANPADTNFDGCVQLNDLLDLLSSYGDCVIESSAWQCGDALAYQGYAYATVLIAEQCWFAENLRSENYENGDVIASNLTDLEWGNTSTGAVTVHGAGPCYFSHSPDIYVCDPSQSLSEYGRLYNWYAVDDARGLCPSGWHVPSDGEWMALEMALGMSEVEANSTGYRGTDQGVQMKATYGWAFYSPNGGNGTNSSNYSGLPGGYCGTDGAFVDGGRQGYWWTSFPHGSGSRAWFRYLSSAYTGIGRYDWNFRSGLSVRCMKDLD